MKTPSSSLAVCPTFIPARLVTCTVAVLISAGSVFLTACQSPRVRLNDAQQQVACELKTIQPETDPLATTTPIIDIHTHTFNARYLPLKGILLGKRDSHPPFTWLISDSCAKTIAQVLVDRTELAPILPNQTASKPDTTPLRKTRSPGLLCSVFLDLIDKAIAAGVWEPAMDLDTRMEILDDLAAEMNVLERMAVQTAVHMMGMQDHTTGGKETVETVTGIQAAVRFIWTVTQNDAEMTELYHKLHLGPENKGPTIGGQITMISHMMDLGPVYNQDPDDEALLDFETQQVRRMEYYQGQPGSDLIYFVAYNPYRNHLTNASATTALELVRDAIDNHGAKGVKVYPPSGYRPADNQIKRRPCALFTRYPGRQWDARYARLCGDKNLALDLELNQLLEWCIQEDVPVFVHSGYGEFEARKGYGEHHSNPVFWKKFLESHSRPGDPCKLRLCLGHAGGEDYWFGTGKHSDWGRICYALCTNYPNVYCEVTTSHLMIEPTTQAYFVDRLITNFTQSAEGRKAANPRSEDDPPYAFAKKLIFGTDWPLPDQGKPDAVLRATQKAFLHPSLIAHYADYFSGNAKRYLIPKWAPKKLASAISGIDGAQK